MVELASGYHEPYCTVHGIIATPTVSRGEANQACGDHDDFTTHDGGYIVGYYSGVSHGSREPWTQIAGRVV